MPRRPRRNHTPAFKARVAIAAIKGDQTLLSLLSSSMSIPIRSQRGHRSWRRGEESLSPDGGLKPRSSRRLSSSLRALLRRRRSGPGRTSLFKSLLVIDTTFIPTS